MVTGGGKGAVCCCQVACQKVDHRIKIQGVISPLATKHKQEEAIADRA